MDVRVSYQVSYAVRIVCSKRHKTVECLSVRPSAAAAGGFAAEVGHWPTAEPMWAA